MAIQLPAKLITLRDLLHDLGGISPSRIRLRPPPGRATEKDVIRIEDREDRLCELVDGVLVEKVMGAYESLIASNLIRLLGEYVEREDLGVVLGEAGMLKLEAKLVRIPDVCFISWDQMPNAEFPDEPIPELAPDLAVEVLSKGNTAREMARKLREYFAAGTRLVWMINPKSRIANVYSSPDECRMIRNGQMLDGGEVLPGFTVPLKDVFGRTRRRRS